MFNCDKCGACCRNLEQSVVYKELDRGDGICKYLNGNICSVYERRPLLCRIDECYEHFFKETLSLEDYYKLNYQACDKLKQLFLKE